MKAFQFNGTKQEQELLEHVVEKKLPEHKLEKLESGETFADYKLPECPAVSLKLGMLIAAVYEVIAGKKKRRPLAIKFTDN